MSANNQSRVEFKQFCVNNGFEPEANRNVFVKDGHKWAYCRTSLNGSVRQFYDDCSGVYASLSNAFVSRKDLKIQNCTRISPNGVKAFNAVFVFS